MLRDFRSFLRGRWRFFKVAGTVPAPFGSRVTSFGHEFILMRFLALDLRAANVSSLGNS